MFRLERDTPAGGFTIILAGLPYAKTQWTWVFTPITNAQHMHGYSINFCTSKKMCNLLPVSVYIVYIPHTEL